LPIKCYYDTYGITCNKYHFAINLVYLFMRG